MPDVGGKKFAYTPEGEAAAAEYAEQIGAPFQMRAKGFNNSPMQKNFGPDLALNKKLDKNDTEGGLTGGPNLGKLDGPMKFKFPKMSGIGMLSSMLGGNNEPTTPKKSLTKQFPNLGKGVGNFTPGKRSKNPFKK
jgi:hypothetical protein